MQSEAPEIASLGDLEQLAAIVAWAFTTALGERGTPSDIGRGPADLIPPGPHLAGTIAGARGEVLALLGRHPVTGDWSTTRSALNAAAENGARITGLCAGPASSSEAWQCAHHLRSLGGSWRRCEDLPVSLVVLGQSTVVLQGIGRHGPIVALKNSMIVSCARALFRAYWTMPQSRPLAPAPGVPDISQLHQQVLRCLSEGSKDEAIARQLHVSTRSVRRAVAELMEVFDSTSRFQLATAAARTGSI